MDFVLFDDTKPQQGPALSAGAVAMPVGALAANALAGPMAALGAGVDHTGALPSPMAIDSNYGGAQPLLGTGVPASTSALQTQQQQQAALLASAAAGQPLALGGFGAYRQPVDPTATPTPQQLASLVASQHAAKAASSASNSSRIPAGSSFGAVFPTAASMASSLSGQGQRNANEQTSPFMGANAPLSLGQDCDAMPLFPSGSSKAPRQSSLNSTCSSSGPSNEISSMDVFNGSPVNPPSGSFGPPIQNLSLGSGSAKSEHALRGDSMDSYLDAPLFPQSNLSSSAATPSAVSMQATNSSMTTASMDSTRNGQTEKPDSNMSTASSTGSSAASSLFSMAQQQRIQNQVSAGGSNWPSNQASGLSKDEEDDLLSTPKAREQPMAAASSWSNLFGVKAPGDSSWFSLGAGDRDGASGAPNAIGTGIVGAASGAPDMGTPSNVLPLSLGGGFFPTQAISGTAAPPVQPVPLNIEALTAAQAMLGSTQEALPKRPVLRGPSAANASAGNSASSGLSLFAASESSTLDENDDDSAAAVSGIESAKPPQTALQAIAKSMDLGTTEGKGPLFGSPASKETGQGQTGRRQQPTQLSMLANSTLFGAGDGHDAPRFTAIDSAGTSESDDDERELEESIRKRRQQQHLMRQQGLLLDPLVHGPNLSSSASSISIPGADNVRRGSHGSSKTEETKDGNSYLGVHPGFSRRSSTSTSEDDSLMSPPIRDSAESADHFGSAAVTAAHRAAPSNFRSQASRGSGGSGAGKGKTGGPGHPANRTIGSSASRGVKVNGAAEGVDEEEEEDDDEEYEDAEDEDEVDEDEDDDEYADAIGQASTSTRGGRGGARRGGAGRNTRNSRSVGSHTTLAGSASAPAQKRRKRLSPKADEPVNISNLGGSHTTSTGLTVCDYISPLVMRGLMADGQTPSAAAIKEARCGTIFHRPYDLSRHRETIHAREEARLVKTGTLKVEECVVMGKEIAADKVMAGATEWKCEGKNGCGSVFSRKDALLRHQRIRGHGR